MRGLIKATAHYSNLAARQDWLAECAEQGVDPNIVDWQRLSHRLLDDALLALRRRRIRSAMRPLVNDCVDRSTGEVNRTQLAENAAHALNHDEWLDDSNHMLWELAISVADAHERRMANG